MFVTASRTALPSNTSKSNWFEPRDSLNALFMEAERHIQISQFQYQLQQPQSQPYQHSQPTNQPPNVSQQTVPSTLSSSSLPIMSETSSPLKLPSISELIASGLPSLLNSPPHSPLALTSSSTFSSSLNILPPLEDLIRAATYAKASSSTLLNNTAALLAGNFSHGSSSTTPSTIPFSLSSPTTTTSTASTTITMPSKDKPATNKVVEAGDRSNDSRSRRYYCNLCSKSFSRPSSLSTHQHSHTGARPHQCTECSKRFSVLSNLRRHKRIHLKDRSALSSVSSGASSSSSSPSPDDSV